MYLVSHFRAHDNERSLALQRIHSATASRFDVGAPPEIVLARYDDDGRFGCSEGKFNRLSFAITKDAGLHLLESPLSKDQQVKEVVDGYEIAATVVQTAILEKWLRGFGLRFRGRSQVLPPTNECAFKAV